MAEHSLVTSTVQSETNAMDVKLESVVEELLDAGLNELSNATADGDDEPISDLQIDERETLLSESPATADVASPRPDASSPIIREEVESDLQMEVSNTDTDVYSSNQESIDGL